ncbi:FecR family protein [Nautilia sp.]
MRFLIILLGFYLYASIGYVKDVRGKAEILKNGKIFSLKIKTDINVDDTVFTGENGKVKMVFKDDTIVTIGKNSVFKVREYVYGKKPKARFGFLKGTFVSVTGKIGKIAPERFKLETKNASIGIRGTTVFGSIYYGGDVIGCSSGVIEVTKGSKRAVVKSGEMLGVFGNTVTKPFKVPVNYAKAVAENLGLSKKEERMFLGGVLNEYYKARENLKQNKKTLSWKNYKTEKIEEPENRTFEPINFDNGVFYEYMKYR